MIRSAGRPTMHHAKRNVASLGHNAAIARSGVAMRVNMVCHTESLTPNVLNLPGLIAACCDASTTTRVVRSRISQRAVANQFHVYDACVSRSTHFSHGATNIILRHRLHICTRSSDCD